MKRCPACQRTYLDDSLSFCLDDGSALLGDGSGASDLAATIIIPEPRMTVPRKQDAFRQDYAPHQPFTQPPPAWPPVAAPQALQAVPARHGRGAAVTALICAIAAFVLLGFCVISGANDVDARLIGGIFILSVLLALAGAVFGIVATARSSKDTSAQNSKAMAVVALVLNGLYLLISVIFLILGAVASSS
jgi:hypothetical protein